MKFVAFRLGSRDRLVPPSGPSPTVKRKALDAKHVKTRNANGTDLHYVEGWHVIAEANRIFGYDAWDRRTLASHCVWSGQSGAYHGAAYTAKVRVSVRAEISQLCGRDQGPGKAEPLPRGKLMSLRSKVPRPMPPSGRSPPLAIPSGLPFMTESSLACAKREANKSSLPIGPWMLRSASGAEEASFDKPSEFAGALRTAMTEADDIELLFAIWEQNVDTVRALNRSYEARRVTEVWDRTSARQSSEAVRNRARKTGKTSKRLTSYQRGGNTDESRSAPRSTRASSSIRRNQASSLQGASPLRGKSTLSHLWALTLSRAPHTLRAS